MPEKAGPRASIRRRVLTTGVLVLALMGSAFVFFIHGYSQAAADRAFDRLLTASGLSIAGAVLVDEGRVTVELPFASLAMLSSDSDRVYYQVEDADGSLVTGYDDLGADLPPAVSADPVFDDLLYRGEAVRVATVGRLTSTGDSADWVTIRVAETRVARGELAWEIFIRAALPAVAMLAAALALLAFGIRRAFAPLRLIERDLHRRMPGDLSPVALPVPVEVSRLVAALNDFMNRLDATMGTLSGVVADAAHQVRTPLASLRAQAEIALEETDPARLADRVRRIHKNAVQASDLVSQLLMEATVAHRLGTREVAPVTVAAVIEDMLARLDPADEARLSLAVDPAAGAARLLGDRLALREMLRNLVGNALHHAPDGPVDVSATLAAGRVRLLVEDRGPGISDAEKPLVLERFRRGLSGEARAGSGLGLSIVRNVVVAHGGALTLADRVGGGLSAAVEIPLPAEPIARRIAAAAAVFALLVVVVAPDARAAEVVYPAANADGRMLTIVGTTDTPIFEAFIAGFQRLQPDVGVTYIESDTLPIFEMTVAGTLPAGTDILVSSAPDLQLKLANDGFALSHASPHAASVPAWAQWHDEVFGFTFEPAVIVYNRNLVADDEVPRSHIALTELLEARTERFRGLVATYDIAVSGVGHFLAAQDAQITQGFWRLTRALGRVDARLSGSSPDILDGIESGELALAYNVLGSYAFSRLTEGSPIGVVVPEDYALVLTRTILIPRVADDADLARAFLDFALSPAGQSIAAGEAALGAVVPGTVGPWSQERISAEAAGALQPTPLGPALLVFLDFQRNARFLETWRQLIAVP